MRGDPVVTDLVARARSGDKQAWDALVDRYSPLIWSICRRCRLDDADAEDVGQNVWLQLVDQIDTIREPAALPGWLATTTPSPPSGPRSSSGHWAGATLMTSPSA